MTNRRRTVSEEVRREQLLAAARRLFGRKGYDATAVSDIVREAGVAQGTFYLYFPAKRDAALALADLYLDETRRRFIASYNPWTPFDESLRRLVRAAFQAGADNPDLCRLIPFIAGPTDDESPNGAARPTHPVFRDVTQMFQRAIDAGELRAADRDAAVHVFVRLLTAAVHAAFVANGDPSRAAALETATLDLVINGLRRR